MKTRTIFLFAFYILLFSFVRAQDTIYVPQDYTTIQQGIDAAVNGNVVLVDTGTYYENINFYHKAITIASYFLIDGDTNHINNTIIDGSEPDFADYASVVTCISGEDTTSVLYGFTITGGTGTYIPIDNMRVGGGIMCYYSTIKILNNKIINNECSSDGEADGGGIFCWDEAEGKWIVIENNTIRDNSCHGTNVAAGGGLVTAVNARIINNVIENNFVSGENIAAMGGGVFTQSSGIELDTVYLFNNTIQHNIVTSTDSLANGGGLFSYDNYIIIKDNLIHHDSLYGARTYGAGIYASLSSYLEMENNMISNNVVEKINKYWGVGVICWQPQGPVHIMHNEFSYNVGELSATGAGGGLSLRDAYDHPVVVDGNKFLHNSAFHGAGFYERSTYNLKLSNNTFIGNESDRAGAIGIFHSSLGSEYHPLIVNNTFNSNSASTNAGAIRFTGSYQSPPVIMNCIFWENSAPVGQDIFNNVDDTLFVGYSDIDESLIDTPWTGKGNINQDPGFIDDTCHIDEFSPCEDAGADSLQVEGVWYVAPGIDFEGTPRPWHMGVDIGADECDIITLIPSIPGIIQNSKFKISCHPNPTRGISHFAFHISQYQYMTIKIYDIHGREIAVVVDEKLQAGEHVVQFDASGLPNGIYLVRVMAGETTGTQKIIKMRAY